MLLGVSALDLGVGFATRSSQTRRPNTACESSRRPHWGARFGSPRCTVQAGRVNTPPAEPDISLLAEFPPATELILRLRPPPPVGVRPTLSSPRSVSNEPSDLIYRFGAIQRIVRSRCARRNRPVTWEDTANSAGTGCAWARQNQRESVTERSRGGGSRSAASTSGPPSPVRRWALSPGLLDAATSSGPITELMTEDHPGLRSAPGSDLRLATRWPGRGRRVRARRGATGSTRW
jgi:hypothetical protein